jgi:hypothetical protein
MKKKTSKKWFIKVRGSYLPNSWQGWLTYIPYIALLVIPLVNALADTSARIYDRIFNLLVAWMLASAVMTWFAKQKS